MNVSILIITVSLELIITAFFMLYRNYWVWRIQTNALGTPLDGELLSYEDMLFGNIFTFDLSKLTVGEINER